MDPIDLNNWVIKLSAMTFARGTWAERAVIQISPPKLMEGQLSVVSDELVFIKVTSLCWLKGRRSVSIFRLKTQFLFLSIMNV